MAMKWGKTATEKNTIAKTHQAWCSRHHEPGGQPISGGVAQEAHQS